MKKFLLSLLTVMCVVTGLSAETLYYTLDGTQTATGNAYASASTVTQGGMTWMVTGNTEQNPWRIGGKKLTGEDRPAYSTTAMGSSITKVDLTIGNITLSAVNSIKLIVASDAAFSAVLDEITKTGITANSTLTFEPTSGTEWATGAYYKFVFNVTTSGTSNQFVHFTKAEFYADDSGASVTAPTISPNGGSDLTEAQTVTISGDAGDTFYYTLDGSTPSNESTEYTAPFTVSETTTVKAIAYNAAGDASTVTSAIFSFRVAASSIADLYTKTGKDDSTQVYVNFPLTVTAAGANTVANTYVMDGQGGYSMIYKGGNTAYNVGDVIPGGWYATVQTYGGLDEIKPTANTPAASSTGASVDYPGITAADVIADYQSQPATLRLTFDAATPSTKSAFTGVSGETTVSLYNTWILESRAAGTYDVKGVVSVNNNNPQFLPIEFVEVQPEPVPDVYILGNVDGNEWAPNVGVQMHYNEVAENYTATIHVGATGGSFNMATALGEDADWSHFNGNNYRWGVQGGGDHNVTVAEYGTALGAQLWDNNTGAWFLPVGNYNLTWTFTGEYTATLVIEKAPSDVYILGTVNTTAFNWVPYEGVLMTRDEDTGLYSAEVYAEAGDRINFAHFLGSTWAEVNVPGNRFSVPNQNYMVNDTSRGIQMAYSTDPYSFEFGTQGKWEVVVNLDNEGEMTVDFTKLTFAAPTFSEESKEFHAAFDLTITGPEGSTITYVLNDDLDNAVTTQSNVAVVNIPAEDTSVLAWATLYGVDSESAEENYLYSASTGTTYTKLASGAEIKAGKYLIVYEVPAASGSPLRDATTTSVLAFNGSRTDASDNKLDATYNTVSLTAEDGAIVADDDIYFTITPLDGGGCSIQSASGKYIGITSFANGLKTSDTNDFVNYVSVGNDGAEIRNTFDSGDMLLKFNSSSGQERFRYYKYSTTTGIRNIELYYSDTTGVDKVAASDSEVVSTAYYNLQGVRLAAPAQGQIAIRVSTLANGQIRASKVVVR